MRNIEDNFEEDFRFWKKSDVNTDDYLDDDYGGITKC